MSPDAKLLRLAAASATTGGVLTALFWLLVLPLGTFVGADVALNPLWLPSQTLHVAGALFAVFGFTGIYAVIRQTSGGIGILAFFFLIAGTIFFLADGVIALAVFPALASAAPELLSASGAMNQGIVLASFITFAVVNMLGNLAFAYVLAKSTIFPKPVAVLLAVGGTLFNLPPGPVPIPVLAVGGVLWSVALCWCGNVLLRHTRGMATAA